jgi:hypothetical protein
MLLKVNLVILSYMAMLVNSDEEKPQQLDTHLWSRLSPDKSTSKTRDKRELVPETRSSSWTNEDRRQARSLLSSENEVDDGTPPPPLFQDVSKLRAGPLLNFLSRM